MKKILLIGQNGQVSTYIQRSFDAVKAGRRCDLIVAARELLDLCKIDQIQTVLNDIAPDVIINPAAYTAVDLAEQETELANQINRDAVAEIAAYCARTKTPLIHFSTDYVFSGDASQAYLETDTPAPSGVYGQSKLEGELAILASGAPALILRTAWVYSNQGKNFYKTMLHLADSGKTALSVVQDQIGAPTFAGSIAEGVKKLVDVIIDQNGLSESQIGIYHFTCQGQTSWSGFAQRIFSENGLNGVSVTGIPSSEYPTPAKRPNFSVLDGTKLQQVFNVCLPNWQDALGQCVLETKR